MTQPQIQFKTNTHKYVLTALFAALTLIGTTIGFKLPAAVGAPFIHFGNVFFFLAVLLLGFTLGSTAGAIGFFIYDILNGYALVAPLIVIEAYFVGALLSIAYKYFLRKKESTVQIVFIFLVGILGKLLASFIEGIIISVSAGVAFKAAAIASFLSLPATAINGISTIILVSLTYFPLKKMMRSFFKNEQKIEPHTKA